MYVHDCTRLLGRYGWRSGLPLFLVACSEAIFPAASVGGIREAMDASRCSATAPPAVAAACCASAGTTDDELTDEDGDGVPDACEDAVAAEYAPVVFHSSAESNFPTNVDTLLSETELAFRDDGCNNGDAIRLRVHPNQFDLVTATADASCHGDAIARSNGSRSIGKHRTFFLRDVPNAERVGSLDSRMWTTYVHAYPNEGGGLTVQYWRVYAFNDALNDHGGDWEGIHVVLDRAYRPTAIRLLGHAGIDSLSASRIHFDGNHPQVFSEGGGHATRASGDGVRARGCAFAVPCAIAQENPATFVRQETWPGGQVSWPGGVVTGGGTLLNVGEKAAPLHGQVFIQYSGLWGSPGFLYMTSGYWGPAYNETSMRNDGFSTAWCGGMAPAESRPLRDECFATELMR